MHFLRLRGGLSYTHLEFILRCGQTLSSVAPFFHVDRCVVCIEGMLLRLSPGNRIDFFAGPCGNYTALLSLDNVTTTRVAFKIKTTAPAHYIVRPCFGVLAEGATKKISLVTQRQSENDAACSMAQFMVQAVVVPEPVTEPIPKSFWKDIPREQLENYRLAVAFYGPKHPPPLNSLTGVPVSRTPTPRERSIEPIANPASPRRSSCQHSNATTEPTALQPHTSECLESRHYTVEHRSKRQVDSGTTENTDAALRNKHMPVTSHTYIKEVEVSWRPTAESQEKSIISFKEANHKRLVCETTSSIGQPEHCFLPYPSPLGIQRWHCVAVIVAVILVLKYYSVFSGLYDSGAK